METIIKFFGNEYFNLISLILGLTGILLAITFYLKSRRKLRVSYETKSFDLIKDNISKLSGFKATFNGEELENLTAVKVIIWNSGNSLLEKNNISTNNPLYLTLNNIEILAAECTTSSDKSNLVIAKLNENHKNRIDLDFEYLDKRQGFVLSILHKGNADNNAKLKGIIKGGSIKNKIYRGGLIYIIEFLYAIAPFIIFGIFAAIYKSMIAGLVFTGLLTIPIGIVRFIIVEFLIEKRVGGIIEKAYKLEFNPDDF